MKDRKQIEAMREWVEAYCVDGYRTAIEHGSSLDIERYWPYARIWFQWESDRSVCLELDCSDYSCIHVFATEYDPDEASEEIGYVTVQYSESERPFRDESDELLVKRFLDGILLFGPETAAGIALEASRDGTAPLVEHGDTR